MNENEQSQICSVCGSTNLKRSHTAFDYNRRDLTTAFHFHTCRSCKSLSLIPIPANLDSYYGPTYGPYTQSPTPEHAAYVHQLELAKLHLVQRHQSGGKLIEIGPAAGHFLSVARTAGYNAIGIERDKGCCDSIRANLGIEMVNTDDPATGLKGMDPCDIVVAWHVIEHLTTLRTLPAALSRAVRLGGIVVFSAPNPSAWSHLLFGRRWLHLDAPRHVRLIQARALDDLMGAHGFVLVERTCQDPVGRVLNYAGWIDSMNNVCPHPRLILRALRVVGRLLSVIMRPFDALPLRGSAYTAIYRRVS